MSTATSARLEAEGFPVELSSRATFSVHDPMKAWLVVAGYLDLFVADVRNGEPSGARHHLLRAEAGQCIFGFPPADGDIALLATSGPDTSLLRIDTCDFSRLSPVAAASLIPLLESWIENLTQAAFEKAPPRRLQRATAGVLTTGDGDCAILPSDGVLWARSSAGNPILLGDERIAPLAPDTLFPFTTHAWLHCPAETQLECFHSTSLPELDPHGEHIRTFQSRMLEWLAIRHHDIAAREKARLAARERTDATAVGSALVELASPFHAAAKTVVVPGAGGDPLVLACRAVGNALGVEIRPMTRALRALGERDPVGAIARASRLRTRQVILKSVWWKHDSGPFLAFLGESKRPVALLPLSPRSYAIWDPITGTETVADADNACELQGVAHTFYRPLPSRRIGLADVLSFGMRGQRRDLLVVLLTGIGIGVLALVTPVFTGILFDTVIPGAQKRGLVQIGFFIVVAAISAALFTLTRSLTMLRLEGGLDASIQAAMWDRLLALPVPFFRQFTSGDLARRSLAISQIRQTLTGSALTSLMSGIFSAVSVLLLFYYSPALAILAVALVGFAFVVFSALGFFQVRYLRDALDRAGRIAGMCFQFVNGIGKFRVSGTEGRVFAVWSKEFARQRQIAFKGRRVSNLATVFSSAFPVLATAAVFYIAAGLLKSGTSGLTSGAFLAFNAAFVQFSSASLELSSALIAVLNVVPLWERAKPILEMLPEVDSGKTDPGELSGEIEIHHVSFRYRDDAPLTLHDLSLRVQPGEFVALVGPSASGKSTVFRLLLGFERPTSGAVYFDRHDMADLDLQSLRRQIGVVLQNAKLTTGDIYHNIVGSGALSLDDAWEAARMAGLEDDINAMPMGIHTVVSEGGGGLSGGQRQRLLIARALVNKPRILLFDEATSALDNRTQAIVSNSLQQLHATRVVIAHRLSTIRHADRIYVLNKGLLVEEGTYEELMARAGFFATLAKRQLT
jgi:ATP-binding cassette subfamily C protein